MRRAQTLLALATGISQQAAGQAAGLSRQTVRQRHEEGGGQAALAEAPRNGGPDGPRLLDASPADRQSRGVGTGVGQLYFPRGGWAGAQKTNCSPSASSTSAWGR